MTSALRKKLVYTPELLGFAAHWTWIWCVFWSPLFYGEADYLRAAGHASGGASLEPLWIVSLSANVMTIVFFLVASHTGRSLGSISGLPLGGGIVTALGTLALSRFSLAYSGSYAVLLYEGGAFITGIGSGIVVVMWAELFASLGSKRTVRYSVASLLIAAVLYLSIRLFPLDGAQPIVALLPLASMGFFLHCKCGAPRLPRHSRGTRVREKPPWRLISIALFFGMSFGIMKGFLVPVNSEWIVLRDLLNIAAIAGGSLAIFVTMSVCKMDFDHLTYQIALPLMAVGFLFLPLQEPWNIIGTAIHQAGYQYFYIVLWALWPVVAARSDVPAGWVASWGLLSIQGGQLLGSITASFAVGFVTSRLQTAMLSAGFIFVILIIALFALGSGSANTAWGFIKPIEEDDAASEFEKTGTRLAQRCHLSPREIEVFFLLAKGRNRAFISEKLIIGDETTKSHIKSIYRKTEVHSQQELIDLIETSPKEKV